MSRAKRLAAKVGRSVRKRLPGRARGWLEFKFDRDITRRKPFNDQAARTRLVLALVEQCGFEQIVETGTYRGDTTAWFSRLGLPVASAEIVPYLAWAGRYRFAREPNLAIHAGNSVEMLERLRHSPGAAMRKTLFYLDAHWFEFLPLRDEVALVTTYFPRSVTMIDDFEVPGDPGYSFDDYGPDKKLTLDYLRPVLTPASAIFYPSTHSSQETGPKRGSVVITRDQSLTRMLDELPLLRRFDDGGG